MNIVLTGPMGSGKSEVGKMAANELGMTFTDTDEEIVKRAGQSIEKIFKTRGEDRFRDMEEAVVKDLSKESDQVIATGGGCVLRPINMRRLRLNGVIINLSASIDTLIKRTGDSFTRPLLKGDPSPRELLNRIIEERRELYLNADHFIETDSMSKEDVFRQIASISELPRIRICACIAGADPLNDISKAPVSGASMIELRLDLINDPDIPALINSSALPVIATDRKTPSNLQLAVKAGCDLIDVAHNSPDRNKVIEIARAGGCQVIVSFHDFEGTPESLDFNYGKADIIKLATKINSKADERRLLAFLQDNTSVKKIIIGMGRLGKPTRLFYPLLGSYLTYASMGRPAAPGQFGVEEMRKLYQEEGLG